jgi:photosystem II stability/assembly factor-like uncharacterized protein
MHRPIRAIASHAVPLLLALLAASPIGAQARATTPPPFKGILEPVSYTEDLDLTDVVFVSPDVGWVSGKGGTILHTSDGGATWAAQLGGDPEAQTAPVRELYFLDERRGWAVQGEGVSPFKMLYAADGESWEEIGTVPHGTKHLVFTSPRTGFLAGNPSMSVSGPNIIFRTDDGGRTWKPVWTCQAKVAMGGLNQTIDCVIGGIHFPTPDVGYAVAFRGCTACGPPPLIARTTDGGATWSAVVGPGVLEADEVSTVFFLDQQTGFARLASRKLHMTTDGGATWRGIVATPGEAIQFADPSVGWAIELGRTDLRLSFTTDGGKRWNSREVKLPATIKAFSFPRRDRAFIVGESGMVFRYRVVPASHAVGPNDKVLPAMPAFESPLDEQVAQLEKIVTDMGAEIDAMPDAGGQGSGAPSSGAGAASAATAGDAQLPPPSAYMASCCRKSSGRLEAILGALAQTVPEFIGKYRNLNLLLAALRTSAELPEQYRAVTEGLRSFRTAQDKQSAAAALATVRSALERLKQTTAVAMQETLPPASASGASAMASPPEEP